MAKSVHKVLTSVINKAEQQMTEAYAAKLREHAEKAGWPKDIINKLSMTYDQKHHQIVYPEELESQIKDLEYGTLESSPMPALRTFTFGNN